MIINLTQDQTAVVDDSDADLALLRWFAVFAPSKVVGRQYYAVRNIRLPNGKQRKQHLHRVVLGRVLGRELTRSESVDHKNGDGLDNTRANLRLATPSQNGANQDIRKDNTSGVKGVCWHKHASKWVAQIRINGKSKYLGLFTTLAEASTAYLTAAEANHAEFQWNVLTFQNKPITPTVAT